MSTIGPNALPMEKECSKSIEELYEYLRVFISWLLLDYFISKRRCPQKLTARTSMPSITVTNEPTGFVVQLDDGWDVDVLVHLNTETFDVETLLDTIISGRPIDPDLKEQVRAHLCSTRDIPGSAVWLSLTSQGDIEGSSFFEVDNIPIRE